MVGPLIARVLRIVSLAMCLIAVGWFVGFAVEQSKNASAHQQAELNGTVSHPPPANAKKSGVREAVDSAFSTISSPFSGLTSGMSSTWTLHIVDTLLALLIYGFGLGFLARQLRLSS